MDTVLAAIGAVAAAAVLTQWLRDRRAIEEKKLALEERRLALEEQRSASTLDPEEVPVDLQMRCNAETEDWAREQLRSLVTQLYAKHKNWDSVRTELYKLDMVSASAEHGWSITRMSA